MIRLTVVLIAVIAVGCMSTIRRAPIERIVFASTRGGNTDIYLANVDGTGLERLTHDAAADRNPRCSRDRRHVVFVRGDGTERAIYRLDLATRTEHRLTPVGTFDYTPAWSPDGERVYFTRGGSGGQSDRIAEMRRDGTDIRFHTDGAFHDVLPAPSGDDRSLVYHSYRYERGNTELHMIERGGTAAPIRLTDSPTFDYEATFAGENRVLFSSNREGGYYRLYEVSLTDLSVRRFADTGADSWGARYSPRSGVLFYTGTGSTWRLMRSAATGGLATPILDDGFSNSGADWC